jgi:hypothetical protein
MLRKRILVWLPRTLAALAPWMANFALKFEQFAISLGLTAGDIAQVNKINDTVQWLLAAKEAMDANAKGFNMFRDETLYLDKDDPAPLTPITTMPEPPVEVVWGIVDILDNLVGRIKLANLYTDEIGAQLGILPPPTGSISPEDLDVKGEYFPAAGGHEMAVVASNRGKADQAVLQIRVVGQEKWLNAKTFTGKGTNYAYEDAPEGQPIQIQARIQLMKNNQPYGNPSAAVYVTLNP